MNRAAPLGPGEREPELAATTLYFTLRLDEVLRLIVADLRRLVTHEGVALLLLDQGRLHSTIVWGRPETVASRRDQDVFGQSALLRRIVDSGQSVLVGDAQADPDWTVLEGFEHVRCWMGAPLLARDRVIGILALVHSRPNAYTLDDVRLVEALAARVGLAVDNARLYEEARRRADHMAALNEVAATVSQSLDLQQTLRTALDKALDVVGVDAGAISLVDEMAGELVIRVHRGWRQSDLAQRTRVKLGEGLSGRAAVSGEVVVTGDVRGDPRLAVPQFAEEGVQAMALVPMRARGRVVGILGVMHYTPYAFSSDSIEFLKALADQIGVAIDNARLYEAEYARRRTSEVLREISGALASTLDLNQAFSIVLQHLADVVDYDRASIALFEAGQARVQAAHGFGSIDTLLRTAVPIRPGSPLSRVMQDQRPLVLSDASGDLDWGAAAGDAQRAEVKSWLGAPLLAVRRVTGQEVIGALMVESRRPRAYTEEDAVALLTLANHLAIAVENARLFTVETRGSTQMRLINEIGRHTTATLDLDELLDRAAGLIFQRFAYRAVSLFLFDAQAGEAVLRSSAGRASKLVEAGYRQSIGRGLVGRALRTRQPVIAARADEDPDYVPIDDDAFTGSELVIPLQRGGVLLGALAVQHERTGFFLPDVVEVLQTLSDQLSIAIENARLYQEMEQRLAEMSTLQTFAQKISTLLDLSEVLDTIVITLREVLSCRGVSLALLLPDTQMLQIRAAAGIQAKWKREARLKLGEGISGRVALTAVPLYVPDTLAEPGFIFFDPVVRSLLCVPLMIKDRVIGTLTIDQTVPDAFTKNDERVLAIAAAQASVAIENAQLYEELKERARKLEQAYHELQESDRLKDELVQNVSHELRTPLTFIKGYVELLLEEDMGPLTERQRESLSIVAEKTNSVTRLVSDIIFLEQIERESLQLRTFNLADLARAALQGCEVIAVAAGIRLRLEAEPGLPPLPGDRDRIMQVFDNLLANAIKFSPRGGTITVRLQDGLAVGQADAILTSVSDTGIGIPPQQIKRIFERFYQVDGSATRHFGGAGVGLAIVRRIVEAHGGTIWAESDGVPGRGSTFFFTLPKIGPIGAAGGRR
ncbi:MAG TPA: GAF domain-containing protein [Anaerolineae bacterium]|nr:GAF domain-containing protein [Anaerolineae bacterium]